MTIDAPPTLDQSFSPEAKRTLVICAMASVVALTFARLSYSLLQTAINSDLLGSNTLSGTAGTIGLSGYILGVTVVSLVARRFDPIQLMRAGVAVALAALVLLSVAPTPTVFIAGLFTLGAGSASIWIPLPTIATAPAPPTRRGLVMGIMSSSMGLGLLIMSQITNAVRSAVDDPDAWRQIWGIEAGFTGLTLIAVTVFLRPAPTQASVGSVKGFAALRMLPGWALATGAYVGYGFVVMAVNQFFGEALEADAGFSRNHTSNLYALIGLAAIPGATLLGRLSDRFGRGEMMSVGATLCSLAALLVLVGSEPWAALSAIVFGIGSFGFPIIVAAYVADHVEAREFSAVFGVMTIIFGVGQMAGPQFAGLLADRTGFTTVFVICAGVAMVSAALALALTRSNNRAAQVPALT